MQNKTKNFETFLKRLFWTDSNSKETNSWHREQAMLKKVKKRGKQTLQNIISFNFPNTNTPKEDIDDLAAKNWNSTTAKAKQNLMSGKNKTKPLFDFFNQEINPHAHISKFLSDNKNKAGTIRREVEEELPGASWPAKLASVAAMALIAAIMITRFPPTLANRIISAVDSIVVEPAITTAYLFGGESALATLNVNEIPAPYQSPSVNQPLDSNILASYIVNNHEQLSPDYSGDAAYIISKEELDGRVAGAWETYDNFEPSEKLTNISIDKKSRLEEMKEVILGIFKKTEEIQIQISKKFEARLLNKIRDK